MKKLFFIFALILSSATFASFDLDDNALSKIAHQAAVRTDLFFCFKAELGGKVSGDQLLDQVILSSCSEKLEEAIALGSTDEEIREIFIEASKKVEEEKAKKRKMYFLN